jgi:hypothetical protein
MKLFKENIKNKFNLTYKNVFQTCSHMHNGDTLKTNETDVIKTIIDINSIQIPHIYFDKIDVTIENDNYMYSIPVEGNISLLQYYSSKYSRSQNINIDVSTNFIKIQIDIKYTTPIEIDKKFKKIKDIIKKNWEQLKLEVIDFNNNELKNYVFCKIREKKVCVDMLPLLKELAKK